MQKCALVGSMYGETEEKENTCALCLMGKIKVFIWEHTVEMNVCKCVFYLGVNVTTYLSNRLISFNGKLIFIIEQMALSESAY